MRHGVAYPGSWGQDRFAGVRITHPTTKVTTYPTGLSTRVDSSGALVVMGWTTASDGALIVGTLAVISRAGWSGVEFGHPLPEHVAAELRDAVSDVLLASLQDVDAIAQVAAAMGGEWS